MPTSSNSFANRWNRFWFSPADPWPACVLRVVVGLAALYYVLSFTGDLETWFGPQGILSPVRGDELVRNVRTISLSAEADRGFHVSYLYFANSTAQLWGLHFAGLAVVAAFTLGWFTRIANIGALLVVMAYYHRAPMLAGQFDVVLLLLTFYLCLAPCGANLSLDAWLQQRRLARGESSAKPVAPSLAANLCLRLMQVHLAGLYFAMAAAMLGNESWTNGTAVWWLVARPESRLFDLTGIYQSTYLINIWTLSIPLFFLAFGVLAWNRGCVPVLLVASAVIWLSIAVITGLLSWCLLMVFAGLAFVPAETLQRWLGGARPAVVTT